MTLRNVVITGITGQDGSYLGELLLSKGYKVYGGIRRNSDFTTKRIDHYFDNKNFYAFNYDAMDPSAISSILKETKPKYFFNLALSHVGTSFDLHFTPLSLMVSV